MINIITLEENTIGTDYIVGDIHGAFRKLDECLSILGFNREVDRLICVGDLVDRGRESEDCINWTELPWFYSVQGNHERLLIDAYRTGDYDLHFQNGGGWFYSLQQDERIHYVEALGALPLTIEIPCNGKLYGVIHAECTNNNWKQTKEYLAEWYRPVVDRAMWARSKISAMDDSVVTYLDFMIVGHTIVDNPTMLGNVLYLDTCGWHPDGKFSFFNVQKESIVSI